MSWRLSQIDMRHWEFKLRLWIWFSKSFVYNPFLAVPDLISRKIVLFWNVNKTKSLKYESSSRESFWFVFRKMVNCMFQKIWNPISGKHVSFWGPWKCLTWSCDAKFTWSKNSRVEVEISEVLLLDSIYFDYHPDVNICDIWRLANSLHQCIL